MQNEIQKVCVIGAGTMGSGIAALIANSSTEVVLLDVASDDPKNRNAILTKAIENLSKHKHPALSFPDKVNFITLGNLEDNLELIKECDLVIEVIIEKLEVKHQLYKKIIPYLKEHAIIASNTSTLPLKQLKKNLPHSVKSRFLITHFFNPPRYMELLELIIDQDVDHKVVKQVSEFLNKKLGKTIVRCNDTPGFIANRIGCFLLEFVVRRAIALKLDPVIIDTLFITHFKLPSTGIFGLYDLIGHDVMKLISSTLTASLPKNDLYQTIHLRTPILDEMLDKKLIGRKGSGGFYRISSNNGKKIKEVINFDDLSYKPIHKSDVEFANINELLTSTSVYGKFFAEIFTTFYLYLTHLIPEVTDNIYDIDLAMKLGYHWKYGPFELLTSHIDGGFDLAIEKAESMGLPLSPYLKNHSFKDIVKAAFNREEGIMQRAKVELENNSAQLVTVKKQLVFIINTKMNCLNTEVFNLLLESIKTAETRKQNLYICSQSSHFSAGADLKFIFACIQNKQFAELEEFLKLGQKTMMKLKYSSVNIVSCAYGAALGGGCEILLHSDMVVANQELNAGLVEIGVGLVPAFGGIKEMFARAEGDEELLVNNLKNILTKNQSSSGDYFIHDYRISHFQVNMNKHLILEEALTINLAPKKMKSKHQIDVPRTNLAGKLDTANYDDLQRKVLGLLQDIIDNYRSISEEELLSIERNMFLELAKNIKPTQKF